MANEYLSRTPSVAGNRKTWTMSVWVKIAAVNSIGGIFSGGTTCAGTAAGRLELELNSGSKFQTDLCGVGAYNQSNGVYRDYTNWYHLVWKFDTTQAYSYDRSIIYINGVAMSDAAPRTFAQNTDYMINSTELQTIGVISNAATNAATGFLGNMSDFVLVDGQALGPSVFGKTVNGQWVPKHREAIKTAVNASGGFGTNGCFLTFGSNLGYDQSGRGNHWTANNFDLTREMRNQDTATNNFAVLNPVSFFDTRTMTDGNLRISGGNDGLATIGVTSGKWYWEMQRTNNNVTPHCGITATWGNQGTNNIISNTGCIVIRNDYGDTVANGIFNNGLGITNLSSELGTRQNWVSGDILSFQLDLDSSPRTLKIFKNSSTGTPILHRTFSYDPTASNAESVFPFCRNNTGSETFFNFGQGTFVTSNSNNGYADSNGKGIFQYQPPTGFLALCEDNIPNPTSDVVKNPQKYVTSVKHIGTGTTPNTLDPFGAYGNTLDLNIIKGVNFTGDWYWYDRVRGNDKSLYSVRAYVEEDSSLAPYTDQTWTTTGRTIAQTASGGNEVNYTGNTYINYCWSAGGAPVTNTAGTRTSQVSANPSAGISIVTFSIASASGEDTIGHGLGVKPDAIIMKARNVAYNWDVWHKGMGAITNSLILNDGANGVFTNRQPFTASTEPTSSVFSVRNAFYGANTNFVAYLFKSIPGYSKFCYFLGNGAADGTYVHLGFKPKFIMIRPFGAANNWSFFDSSIDTYNNMGTLLRPNMTDGYLSSPPRIDFLANGFKTYTSGLGNDSTGNICFAWADQPFDFANPR